MPQTQINVLGQSFVNKNAFQIFNDPDTDCRIIKYSDNAATVVPNFMHDHTIFEYRAPVGNTAPVYFDYPIKTEDRSLHFLVLDNSNNTGSKVFNFNTSYVFVETPGISTFTVSAGKKQVFYGAIINGKLYFKVSVETTN